MSPRRLMEVARRKGLDAVALTDHDSVGGVAEAKEAAAELQMQFVTGIEFNTILGEEDIHVLAYWIDPAASGLKRFLSERRQERIRRVERIIELLSSECGIALDLDEVRQDSDDQALTRLHVARALVKRGYGGGSDEVFQRYMAKGMPAYARQESMSPFDAVELTRELGGVSVLAHPAELERPFELIPKLLDAGLGGLEVYYPDHSEELTARLLAITTEHRLLATGGSDFHGTGSRHTCDLGGIDIPEEAAEELISWPAHSAVADGQGT